MSMSKTGLIFILCGLSVFFASCTLLGEVSGDMVESSVTPADLQCEYLTNPMGIDVVVPRFSWKLIDDRSRRGQKQTAYHVLVASNTMLLERDRGDIWDSGKVLSSKSILVPFGGKPLVSNQDCYWKVRVFDKEGNASAWSSIARFSMGLLKPSDWTGDWICHPDASPEEHLWFRKSFDLDRSVKQAFVHVASVGYHELYINGQKADDRVLAPALSRLDKRVLYITYDLAALLKPGRNTIALWTGPGWSRYGFFKTHFALRVQLDAKLSNGKDVAVVSNDRWRCAVSSSENTGKIKWADNGGESIDARRYVANWNACDFDDSQWPLATKTPVDVVLSAQMMEPSRVFETIRAKKITQPKDGVYQVQLARNYTGWLDIKFRGLSAGDEVQIKIADADDTVQDWGQQNQYIARGEDGEMFRNRFNYSCGRFITLEGLKTKPKIEDVVGYAVGTDFERTGHFTCSNDLFNQIYETDLWTFRCNTTEGFTSDCPHRERCGYGEENFATTWGIGLPNYQSGAFYTKLVRDWSDVQEDNGWIHHTAPQINRHYGGPMWSSAGLNIAWAFYEAYGDQRILESTYPSSRRWLEFLAGHVENGLLQNYADHWGKFLGDWAAPGGRKERGGTPAALYFNNCVYAMNLSDFSKIAHILNKPDDAELYSRRLQELKARIHQRFFHPETATYADGTQVQQAFALLVDIVPEELRPKVLEGIVQDIKGKHPYLDMGSSGLPVLLKYIIEDSGRSDLLFDPLAKTTLPSYGYFLTQGETTWPEYWEVNVPSRIHTCYTGIAAWFTKSLAGIRPDPEHPGFQRFFIDPLVIPEVTFAEASTESPYGVIKSRWEKQGQTLRVHVTIPANSEAIISFPIGDPKSITEGDRPIGQAEGVTCLEAQGDTVILKVQSGIYEFSSKLK